MGRQSTKNSNASSSKTTKIPAGFRVDSIVFSNHALGESFVANQRAIKRLEDERRRAQEDITRRVTGGEPVTLGAAMLARREAQLAEERTREEHAAQLSAVEDKLARWEARRYPDDPFFGDVTLAVMKMKLEQEKQRYLRLVREEQPRVEEERRRKREEKTRRLEEEIAELRRRQERAKVEFEEEKVERRRMEQMARQVGKERAREARLRRDLDYQRTLLPDVPDVPPDVSVDMEPTPSAAGAGAAEDGGGQGVGGGEKEQQRQRRRSKRAAATAAAAVAAAAAADDDDNDVSVSASSEASYIAEEAAAAFAAEQRQQSALTLAMTLARHRESVTQSHSKSQSRRGGREGDDSLAETSRMSSGDDDGDDSSMLDDTTERSADLEAQRAAWNAELERRRADLEMERIEAAAGTAAAAGIAATAPATSSGAAALVPRSQRGLVLSELLHHVYAKRYGGDFYDARRRPASVSVSATLAAAAAGGGAARLGAGAGAACDAVSALVRSIPPGDGEPMPGEFIRLPFMSTAVNVNVVGELSEADALAAAAELRGIQTEDGAAMFLELLLHFSKLVESQAVDTRRAAETMADMVVQKMM